MEFVTLQIQKLTTSAFAQLDLSRSRYGRIVFTLGITHYSCVMYLTSLFCQSEMWKRVYKVEKPITRDDGISSDGAGDGAPDFQSCQEDEIVIGGGGQCLWNSFVFVSRPLHNGWYHDCTSNGSGYAPAQAFAICLKSQ